MPDDLRHPQPFAPSLRVCPRPAAPYPAGPYRSGEGRLAQCDGGWRHRRM